MPYVITTCSKCGAEYAWNSDFQEFPDCPSCGYNSMKELLRKKEEVNGAIERGDIRAVKRFLRQEDIRGNINSGPWTHLRHAALAGQCEAARLLLERGANPNAAYGDAGYDAPLHSAAGKSRYEIARLLIDFGADVRQINHGGETPIDIAAGAGDDEMVDLLRNYTPSPPKSKRAGRRPKRERARRPSSLRRLLRRLPRTKGIVTPTEEASDAFEELRKYPDKDAAVDALMRLLRLSRAPVFGALVRFIRRNSMRISQTVKLLGEYDNDKSREALVEIIGAALNSTEEYPFGSDRDALLGAASTALLGKPDGLAALRAGIPAENFAELVSAALVAPHNSEDCRRIGEQVTQPAEREAVIKAVLARRTVAHSKAYALAGMAPDTLECLFEMYQSVLAKKEAVAAALVCADPDRGWLKARFPGDSYEEFLLPAFTYSPGDVVDALAELGTPAAVERVVRWCVGSADRVALVASLGRAAHSHLLKALSMDFTPLDERTARRKWALAVLAESGDEDCVAAIKDVAAQDASIASEAEEALDAIRRRGPGENA